MVLQFGSGFVALAIAFGGTAYAQGGAAQGEERGGRDEVTIRLQIDPGRAARAEIVAPERRRLRRGRARGDLEARSGEDAAEAFWLAFYESVFDGLFAPAKQRRGRSAADAVGQVIELCLQQARELEQWPLDGIAQAVGSGEAQRRHIAALRETVPRAAAELAADCEQPAAPSPAQRIAAVELRLRAMLRAAEAVQATLADLHGSLDADQRSRFAAIAGSDRKPRDAAGQRQATAFCRILLPADAARLAGRRVIRATRPDRDQAEVAEDLIAAALHANDRLRRTCALDRSGSPLDQLEVMRERLRSAAEAARLMREALVAYYDRLDARQQRRFTRLGYGAPAAAPANTVGAGR